LNWHTYNDHLKEMMQNLMLSQESTDVTLVCEDKTKFKTHKFVLNACSPVFYSIINNLPQKDAVIYLRGIFGQEMKSILQFMYLGQATFYQDRMNDFLNVAKSLEIKEISKDVDCNVADSSQEECDKNIKPNIEHLHEDSMKIRLTNPEEEKLFMSTEIISKGNENDQHPCDKCDKQFSQRKNLIRHMKHAHEGINFPCNDCDHNARSKHDLDLHIQAIHEGIKFQCQLCDFSTNYTRSLHRHKKNNH